MNEFTQERSRIHASIVLSALGNYHIAGIMNKKHAKDSSLKRKQHGQNLKLRIHLQEPTTTHASKKAGMLVSSTEENLSQVESLTCWICEKEFSREPFLIQHYDDHMRYS